MTKKLLSLCKDSQDDSEAEATTKGRVDYNPKTLYKFNCVHIPSSVLFRTFDLEIDIVSKIEISLNMREWQTML